jgi:putative mRNA 3-end processing factor
MLLKPGFGGIWCETADVVIDPAVKVKTSIITHAHSDHARAASETIICHRFSAPLVRLRLGSRPVIRALEYGETIKINGVSISLHPAGHIPGSAQVRIEFKGEVWVASGDYKLGHDNISTPFEPVRCHHFITESTFALPVFRFPDPQRVIDKASAEFRFLQQQQGGSLMVAAYSFGKAQRLAHAFSTKGFLIKCTPAVATATRALQQLGCLSFPWQPWNNKPLPENEILLYGSGEISPGNNMADKSIRADFSGWNHIPGIRPASDTLGYVLSDHADWDELLKAIKLSEAETVWCTHGFSRILARYVREEMKLNGRVWGE